MSTTATRRKSVSPAKRAPKGPAVPAVRVRMYDVGFGDAFVVILPNADRDRLVLIDCGTLAGGGKSIGDVAQNIVADCSVGEGARIDVVIATHRHRDHISGFGSNIWRNVEVGEVWMPWTEDPKDKSAKDIRDRQVRLADSLEQSARLRLGDVNIESDRFGAVVLNAKLDDRAMETLHRGFKGGPLRRFLPVRDESRRTFTTDILPEVTIHALGPSRDEDVIRDMNPPKGESYLRMASRDSSAGTTSDPFGPEWWVAPEEFQTRTEWSHLNLSDAERQTLSKVGVDTDPALAVALDKAVNGTSLVLVLEFRGVRLLFSGDAQWGTWNAILNDAEWRDLLERVSFWKVGHHGSHNGTPKEFVERFLHKDTWTMVSTHAIARWPSIPRLPLMDAIAAKTSRVARSDMPAAAKKPFVVRKEHYIEAVIPCV